jgi:SAM-dependent methyltransferase
MTAFNVPPPASPARKGEARAKLTYLAKAAARRLAWAPADLLQRRNGDLLPPRGLSFVGRGDFELTGREFLGYFTELGGLQPDSRVLDMGCGVGRMAVPLTGYLQEGSYAGFDVGRGMIKWCRRNISRRRPDFEFTHAPVYNRKYNPFGTLAATEFHFPYPDASFDFAFATSLFTHLLQDEVRHYLAEAARVIRPGGTCLMTFFLLTPEAEREIAAGRARLDFRCEVEGGSTVDPGTPEEAVAYQTAGVRAMFAEAGLAVREPVHHGAWANAAGALTLQDIVVASRDAAQ